MKLLLAFPALLACSKQPTPTTIREDAPTPLQLVVLDDYSSRDSCAGVAPRRIAMFVGGQPIGEVEVACRTVTAMPPPQVAGPTISLAAGSHEITARLVGGDAIATRSIELPVIQSSFEDGTDELATKLPIWASDDALEITAPTVRITFEPGAGP